MSLSEVASGQLLLPDARRAESEPGRTLIDDEAVAEYLWRADDGRVVPRDLRRQPDRGARRWTRRSDEAGADTQGLHRHDHRALRRCRDPRAARLPDSENDGRTESLVLGRVTSPRRRRAEN